MILSLVAIDNNNIVKVSGRGGGSGFQSLHMTAQVSRPEAELAGLAAVEGEVEFPWALTATTTAVVTMKILENMV